MPVKKKKEDDRKQLPQDSRKDKPASKQSQSDFIYDKADSVRSGSGANVRVKYDGNTYDAQLTWGQARDGDSKKCTVLVQLKNGKWAKLWFFEKDLHTFRFS